MLAKPIIPEIMLAYLAQAYLQLVQWAAINCSWLQTKSRCSQSTASIRLVALLNFTFPWAVDMAPRIFLLADTLWLAFLFVPSLNWIRG